MGCLVRLNTIRVGFDIGALATPHAPEYVGEPMGVAGAPTSDIRCAAMLELAGNQDRAPCTGPHLQETLRSAIQIRHARNARHASTQATRTSRRRGGRDRICGAVYSLIEENYVLQEGRQAAIEKNLVDFGSRPTCNMPQCGQPVSRVASCRGSSACSTPRGGSFDEI